MRMPKLTGKQKKFAEAYLQTWNASEAARLAGYSEESAGQIGWENLKKPQIAEYIRARAREKDAATVASEEEVMSFFSATVRGNVKDQFGLEPQLADRLRAAENLMKRYSVGEDKRASALNKLDELLKEFKDAVEQEAD